jgi:hypothetical protein
VAVANTWLSPVSAEQRFSCVSRGALPHRRPGNDVTLPREAGIGSHLGIGSGLAVPPPGPRVGL